MMSTKVAERIDEMLRLHGVAPGQLTLEHVERDTTRGGIEGAEAYTRLRLKGLNLALDDFGTGYSSLAELWRMPFNELKIDRMFVAAMLDNAEARAIVKAIIELAHALKMKAVAEGVENVEGLRLLHKLGCDIAQGYVFARPMDAASVATWVRDATPLTYSLAS
jgi:EAL domain-containing protein (putative c-di-GMP-specific phosphodiesterase class I)